MAPGERSVPSISRLKEMCLKTVEDTASRLVYRRISIPVTWVLLHLRVTPNLVSTAGGLFGLVACWALSASGGAALELRLAAFFLIQWAIVLDHVDGEVARAGNRSSPGGDYLDNLVMEVVVHLAWAAALVWMVFGDAGAVRWLWWGAAFVAFKALNLVGYLLKTVMALKYGDGSRPGSGGSPAGRTPVRHWVSTYWWDVKKVINLTGMLAVVDAVLIRRGVPLWEYEGLPFTLVGAYIAVGIPLLAMSFVLDAWNASRGRFRVEVDPYR